ncbi:hypothetical protein [Streptomyces himalayensis]|nr:hypothetical protein [Streptomyces himalayensis]
MSAGEGLDGGWQELVLGLEDAGGEGVGGVAGQNGDCCCAMTGPSS